MVGVAMGGVCIGKVHKIRIALFQLSSMYMYTHLHTHTHTHTHAHTHTSTPTHTHTRTHATRAAEMLCGEQTA